MKRNWMKLILALGVLAALVTSAFAVSAKGIYGDGNGIDPHAISECSCGGFCVEKVSPTGVKKFLFRHNPCPDDYRYNCAEYRYEYIKEFRCNRCGAALATPQIFTEDRIDHLHN